VDGYNTADTVVVSDKRTKQAKK